MARPKKIQSETLIKLIHQYYQDNDKNPKLLRYSDIAGYLQQSGYDIKEYDIRRNKEVSTFIKQLIENTSLQYQINKVFVFKNLDVDEFIKKNSSLPALKKALVERDCYYHKLYEAVCNFNNEHTALKNKILNLEHEISLLIQENTHINAQKVSYIDSLHNLKTENKMLRNILKTNVYPEIANKLLKEQGLIKGGDEIISAESHKQLISDSTSIISAIQNNESVREKPIKSEHGSVVQTLFDQI